jgi:hypothetical protein
LGFSILYTIYYKHPIVKEIIMGKRRKRMIMAKYATKYAKKRAAFNARRGITTPEPTTEEAPAVEEAVEAVVQITEPETIVEEPVVEEKKPNALKSTSTTTKAATRKAAAKPKKSTTTTRKRKTTKAKAET